MRLLVALLLLGIAPESQAAEPTDAAPKDVSEAAPSPPVMLV